MKEYKIVISPKDDLDVTLFTDNRTQARNVKTTCVENDVPCTVTRTAEKEVSFAGITSKSE